MSFSRTSRLLGPAFEHATVADAMRTGIISCSSDTSVHAIAEIMAGYHVHAVVVETVPKGSDAGSSWGIVSDLELARAASRGELDSTAGELAASSADVVAPTDSLRHAARLMSDRGVSHLIVAAEPGARPAGIISTLDLAMALAWGTG